MPKLLALTVAATLTLVLAIACGSSGEGGREVQITQSEDGCTPTRIEADTGEQLKFVMTNETSGIYELEGEEGTEFEEVVVPEGKSRSAGFTVPNEEGTYPLKCYVPDGVETIIEIKAILGSGSPAAAAGDTEGQVNVELSDFHIATSKETIDDGDVTFVAKNVGPEKEHELVIVRTDLSPDSLPTNLDGSIDESAEGVEVIAEIEDVAVGDSGRLTIELASGAYVLLCNIVDTQSGTEPLAHYAEGMVTAFTVE